MSIKRSIPESQRRDKNARPIHILYVDDSVHDRELVRHALTGRAGFKLTEAASRNEFETRLAEGNYDLVLSDFNIMGFQGLQVLDMVKAKDPATPVVIVTGTGSEEVAVEAIKRGASDYLIKTAKHIQRLPHTVQEVMKQRRLEEEQKRAEAALRESEERYRQIVETAEEGVWLLDAEGNTRFVNRRMAEMLGYSIEELMNKPLFAFINEESKVIAKVKLASRRQGLRERYDLKFRRKDGADLWAIVATTPLYDKDSNYAGAFGMITDITERKKIEERLAYLAQYDTLTELPNRNLFHDRLSQAMARSSRNQQLLALMFLDLDGFKEVNDTFGHDMGDQVLKAAAQRLKACLRDVDTIARYGGDEFAIIVEGINHAHYINNVQRVAQKLLSAFSSPLVLAERNLFIKASIGIVLYPLHVIEFEGLLKSADTAMYQAKRQGGNSYRLFSSEMETAPR